MESHQDEKSLRRFLSPIRLSQTRLRLGGWETIVGPPGSLLRRAFRRLAPLVVGPVLGAAAAVPFAALGGLMLWGLSGERAHLLVWSARCVAAGAAGGAIMGAAISVLGMETLFHDSNCWK
jgi:hypothetical protein